MAIQTTTMKNALASAYAASATHAALYTSAPGASAGTEVSGGSPAYARKALSWGAPSNGVITASATFDVPAATTLLGGGVHSAISGSANYQDGAAVSSQAFASQGTYLLVLTYTQT